MPELQDGVVYVRCPKSLRDRLKIMAHEKRVTLNQLCRSLLEEAAERLTQTAVEQSGSSSGS
jgi:predicted HicB family RNase H-like nuclease